MNQPQDGCGTGWHARALTLATASLATHRQAQIVQSLGQSHRALGLWRQESSEAFGKGSGWTVGIEAAEAADVQDEENGIAYERQIAW